MTKEEIRAAIFDLSEEERHSLLAEFLVDLVVDDINFSRKELLDNKQGCCPHCQSTNYRKHGMDKGSQRYKCKDCGRTFTEFTGTWMAHLHRKELVEEYLKLMEEELSLDKIKNRLKINKKTAFDWRHKILSACEHQSSDSFNGITESDETFISYSEKGSHNLNRKPHQRGNTSKQRGISDDKVSVIVTADRASQFDFTVVRRGRIRKKDIDNAIGSLTSSQTILCSDSHVSYKGYAIDKGIEYHPLRSDMKQRVIKGIYHIQHVNSLHSHLKRWLTNRFY